MPEKIAIIPAFLITALLVIMLGGDINATTIEYVNCFKVGAVVFGIIYVPLKVISLGL